MNLEAFMMTTLEWIQQRRVIAIVRGLQPQYMLRLAEALYAGGIDLMEVTFNQSQPEAWRDTANAIYAITRNMEGRMLAGAGTVLTEEQLTMARNAGAKYIITPNTNVALIGKIKEHGLAALPGALTPSEIVQAYAAGADAVKVFPAGSMGTGYIQAIKAPLRNIPLMAVGGISEHNAADFIAAGCCGIGVGGNLINKEWIEAGEWEKITDLARKYRKAVG